MPPAESALVVFVPEAEPAVRRFRERFDPSAAAGCAAHITLLYPFKPPGEIDAGVRADLERCFAGVGPIRFSLGRTRRFPGVLYLAPDPAEPFRRLTIAIAERYPETPPYGSRHADIVPHLSIAQVADEEHLDRIAAEFAHAAARGLPGEAVAREVALIDTRSGLWQVRASFSLGREKRS